MKSKREGYSHRLAGGGILLSGLCLGLLAFGESRDADSPTAVGGADYDLRWHTVGGGGVMLTTGGNLELSGTIGQPDAGGPMTGGNFELTAGFWFALAKGDCNTDGGVNLLDYGSFEACLTGPNGGIADEPGCACFDLDDDNDVDASDLAVFQQKFTGG